METFRPTAQDGAIEDSSRKSLHNLLSSYYGIQTEELDEQDDKGLWQQHKVVESTFSGNGEDSAIDISEVTRTLGLHDLMKKTTLLKSETEEMNQTLKNMLYTSYGKLEETTTTVHNIVENSDTVLNLLKNAFDKVVSVEKQSEDINKRLSSGREEIQFLESCMKLLLTLKAGEKLKKELKSFYREGKYMEAISLYQSISGTLSQVSTHSSYAASVLRDLQLIGLEIRRDVLQKLGADDEQEKEEMTAAERENLLQVLYRLGESRETVKEVFVRCFRNKISWSLHSCFPSYNTATFDMGKYFDDCIQWLNNCFLSDSFEMFRIAHRVFEAQDDIVGKSMEMLQTQVQRFDEDVLHILDNKMGSCVLDEQGISTLEHTVNALREDSFSSWQQFIPYNFESAICNAYICFFVKLITLKKGGTLASESINDLNSLNETLHHALLIGEKLYSEEEKINMKSLEELLHNAVMYVVHLNCKEPNQLLFLAHFLHEWNPSEYEGQVMELALELLQEYILWQSFLLQLEFCSSSSCYLDSNDNASSRSSKVQQYILHIFGEIREVFSKDGRQDNLKRTDSDATASPYPSSTLEYLDTLLASNRPSDFEKPNFNEDIILVCILQHATRFWQEFIRFRTLSSSTLEKLKGEVSCYMETCFQRRFRKELLNRICLSFQSVLAAGNERTV
eukprot:jgi/Galph1/1985/GphlegSOOS_G644.1